MYEFLDKRYALALYDVAEKQGKVEEFIQDFEDVVDLLKHNEECATLISHPQISTREKKEIFIKMFKGKIDDELLSFLLILIDKGRIMYAQEKLVEMKKIQLERQNVLIAEVKTVVPMDKEDKDKLIEKLSSMYGKQVRIEEELDKGILGGILIKIGTDIIDGTLKSKLSAIRGHIIQREEE